MDQRRMEMRNPVGTVSSLTSTGSAVFPDLQDYTSLYNYPDNNEPVNLSNNSLSAGETTTQRSAIPRLQVVGENTSHLHSSSQPPPHSVERAGAKNTSHVTASTASRNISSSTPLRQGSSRPQATAYPVLLPHPPPLKQQSQSVHQQLHAPINQHPAPVLLPQTSSASIVYSKPSFYPGHTVTSSPAIQAALNQPVVHRENSAKHAEVISKIGNVITAKTYLPLTKQAPTMVQFLNQPPLHSIAPGKVTTKSQKPRKRSHSKPEGVKNSTSSKFKKVKSSTLKVAQDRFVSASEISGTPLNASYSQSALSSTPDRFTPVHSPHSVMMVSLSGSADNSLLNSEASNDASKDIPKHLSLTCVNEEKFAPVDLRSNKDGEFTPVPIINDISAGPKSLLEKRMLKKQAAQIKGSLKSGAAVLPPHDLYNLFVQQLTRSPSTHRTLDDSTTSSPRPPALGSPSVSTLVSHTQAPVLHSAPAVHPKRTFVSHQLSASTGPQFSWPLYLKQFNYQAAPHSAFSHVEASLVNGFMVGMKVETPLRHTDIDRYWLATIISVYGPLLKLRFDGYGDRSKDFAMLCTSENLHSIGWCAAMKKSLFPPADIRHTQRNWESFLRNALNGAKTVPSYLVGPRASPWPAHRIRQGMRLEVLHEKLPTAVWIAKVIRNVGGRIKLRYEGSIDDATDFWLFYRDRRIRYCGWAMEFKHTQAVIYRPPDEIRSTYEYEAWSEILAKVTRDQSIERIPESILHVSHDIPLNHVFVAGQVLETVHPSGLYISPAKISMPISNSNYILVQIIESDNPSAVEGMPPVTKCCHVRDYTLLPVGWCKENGVKLGKTSSTDNTEFDWNRYYRNTGASMATNPTLTNQRVPNHNFVVNHKLEAVNPANPNQICLATIKRIVKRLMWLEIYTTPTAMATIITDIGSQMIFPAGWCESNNYPLTAPQLEMATPSTDTPSTSQHLQNIAELAPKIYFNHTCFSGPFLSKGRILELPECIEPRGVKSMVKEMLNLLISVGYKSSYILKTLQRTEAPNKDLHPQVIKTMCKGRNYEGVIEICTKPEELAPFCRKICKRLKCCSNLVSTEKVKGKCSENCHTLTKTQFLCIQNRKPGRPSGTNPDGSKKKRRKKRKKVFTPKRNLYIPKYEYTEAGSDNGSASSNSVDEATSLSAEEKAQPDFLPTFSSVKSSVQYLTPAVRPRAEIPERVSQDTDISSNDLQNPLFQLGLQCIKEASLSASRSTLSNNTLSPVHQQKVGGAVEPQQYQIVKSKKKRGRPPKQQSPQEHQNFTDSTVAFNKRYPTVPPLKIRRLEMSPSSGQKVGADVISSAEMNGATDQLTDRLSTPSESATSFSKSKLQKVILVNTKAEAQKVSPLSVRTNLPSNSRSGLLLKAATPRTMSHSALAFSKARLRIESKDQIDLKENPMLWDVEKVQGFLRETDCACLADKMNEHDIDGPSFMLLVLPIIQEELELKLGPAIKLCHHVQRLKLAYYEKFHPEILAGDGL